MTSPMPEPGSGPGLHHRLDAWIDAHFDEEVRFLQALVRIPTDTPPGLNAPHAEATRGLLAAFGFDAEAHPVPEAPVRAAGLGSITNLVVRRAYGPGRIVGLAAHGDVVPPGPGWTHDPYGGEIVEGRLYGRAAAVSKSDFATYAFATRALESLGVPLAGGVELYFTYDEEVGGALGPGWLLEQGLARCELLVAAGFAHEVVTAHSGCLQMEVVVHGEAGHAAVPETAIDALRATVDLLGVLYARHDLYHRVRSKVPGIAQPTLVVGRIDGGTATNVVPGAVTLRLDRRMIPEENPVVVEREMRVTIDAALAPWNGVRAEVRTLLVAHPLKPLPGNAPLVDALRRHAEAVFGEPIPERGTPLYTDARLFGERGIPAVLYGAGPRTVLESNAKRADEHLVLDDLRGATQVVARALLDLLKPASR